MKYLSDDIMTDNLAGQLWFGAECLAAGSSIMNKGWLIQFCLHFSWNHFHENFHEIDFTKIIALFGRLYGEHCGTHTKKNEMGMGHEKIISRFC